MHFFNLSPRGEVVKQQNFFKPKADFYVARDGARRKHAPKS